MRAFLLKLLLLSRCIHSDGGEIVPEYATSSMMAVEVKINFSFWNNFQFNFI